MKRLLGSVITGIALLVAIPVFDVSAAVNDFRISSYDIKYELSRDENNRSVLKTQENITANFPYRNQNHGIERALPITYDGHPTHLKLEGIYNNQVLSPYSTNESGGVNVIRIGDADKYVQGPQEYGINYTQHDVTRFYANTNRDEWYWDTNGTEWRVPIDRLSVSVVIDPSLVSALEGEPVCYIGAQGSARRCSTVKVSDTEYRAEAVNLTSGQNITLAYGFKAGTFAPYEPSLLEILYKIWLIAVLVTGVIGMVILILLIGQYHKRRNRTKELHTIVVQYIPPKNTSVMVSSQVITPLGSAFGAQLIDFAVRHIISIIETKPKSMWTAAEYDIQIISDPSLLLSEEQEILSDMFGSLPKVGDRLALSSLRNNYAYTMRTADNPKKMNALIEGEYAIREKSPAVSKFFYRWSIAFLILGLLMFSIPFFFYAGIVALLGMMIRPLTNKGMELRGYLLGLDKYIKAAESERLKMLQGPETAQKVGERVDTDNPGQILKLYERVLPYAILFGREKEWTKRLGEFYQTTNTNPDWYNSTTPLSAAAFAGAMSSFSSSAAYSSGYSSSSGGSSGGGSSGGGGGGGGGGGW